MRKLEKTLGTDWAAYLSWFCIPGVTIGFDAIPMRRLVMKLQVAALCFVVSLCAPNAKAQYLQPPEPLLGIMQAPVPAMPIVDPTGKRLLLVQQEQFQSISRLAEPYLKLAGLRIEPRGHNRHDMANGYGIRPCMAGFTLLEIGSNKFNALELPANSCVDWPVWSANGKQFAFTNSTEKGVELWLGDALAGKLKRVEGVQVNPILDSEIQWLAGKEQLVVKTVPAQWGLPPKKSFVPLGPEIKESIGGKGESSTYEARDTLTGPEDEALFEYYATSQLVLVDANTGHLKAMGKAGLIAEVGAAPDGEHVLIETLQKPFSYVTTWQRFAHQVEVLSVTNGTQKVVARLPVADRVPVRGVATGPREFSWRANQPATLIWAEALDGGDWAVNVPARDKVMTLAAPFDSAPSELTRTKQRFAGWSWFKSGSQALLSEYDANRRWFTVQLMDVDAPSKATKVLWDMSMDEEYASPGNPVFDALPNGAYVLRESNGFIFLSGDGASESGDRPFLDRYELSSGKTERLFRSSGTELERFMEFIGDNNSKFLTWHQSPSAPPNVWIRTIGKPIRFAKSGEPAFATKSKRLTNFPDPTPLVRQIKKRLVTYKRNDGVELSFTLYTPPGYKDGQRVPAIVYAYPLDYADESKAGQVRGSEQTFTRLSNYRLLLLAGYAIIDNAAFPIVGDPKNAYDTYLQQLKDNAEAAVDKAVALGVVDRNRIGITGHSHGALMTANLLAHSDLFRAGVASSGGYNKTLTPFGFQNERRSFWKAPKAYDESSAFFHADKINEPLLIVHGNDDANPGTEVTQSPRLFQAIRGNGGATRLVLLPHEPHWYTAKESNEHFVAEMLMWFDRYVKNADHRPSGKSESKP